MTNKISQGCIDLVKKYEGYHTKLPNGDCRAYLDVHVRPRFYTPGYRGLWTIGYGATGRGITEGTVWTRKQAEADLVRRLEAKAREVNDAVDVPLTQNQFDALVSFAYNLADWRKSTLLKRVNQKDYAGAQRAFSMYNKGGGKVLRGLVRRRSDEAKLFGLPVREEIIKKSRKLTLLEWFRRTILGLGGITAISWESLSQFRDLVAQNQGWIIFAIGATAWLMSKYLIDTSIEDAKDLRYTPSGMEAAREGLEASIDERLESEDNVALYVDEVITDADTTDVA